MKKLFIAILITCVSVLVIFTGTSFIYADTTINYGNQTLSGGFESHNFSDVWDLTQGNLVISFTYDANGLVDADPDINEWAGGDHAWAELGIRDTSTSGNFNPNNKGIWLATDHNEAWPPAQVDTFAPDPEGAPILDMDDKLILQKQSGIGEGGYDLPSSPPVPGNNHRFWFDRDGVDQWQDDSPLAVDGGTYNTGGTFDIVITLQSTGDNTGNAFMTINGLNQGFETDGNWNTMELTPSGMTFTGDMKHMQVFYGIYGYGATHLVAFNNINVTGILVDTQGPITTNVAANPNPAAVNSSVIVTANVDDSTTGGSNITSAEYSLVDNTWNPLAALDGTFDEVNEDVTGSFTAPATPGLYNLSVRGTDAAGNVGEPESIMFVVYDPTDGFVTGGGWIDSPAGAYTADPSLAGKATFGFVSKYIKGATVPTGNTEFQFKVAGLNFHSSIYDWLVVNQGGTNAQFKGTGTINGEGTYRFMLWAGDGSPDTFHIKIWTEDSDIENTVYDNGVDQPIVGGNIVVHKK
jgi:hypothetical protein